MKIIEYEVAKYYIDKYTGNNTDMIENEHFRTLNEAKEKYNYEVSILEDNKSVYLSLLERNENEEDWENDITVLEYKNNIVK